MKDFFDNQPLFYLITDGETNEVNFSVKLKTTLQFIENALDTGIQLIQIREKNLSARLVFQLTSEIVKITKHSNLKILVNERADIALAANADGVHLTSNSIPTKIIRQNFPNKFIIGVSTHSFEKAQNAQMNGADFVTYSPIFHSPNKGKPKGLDDLRQVCSELKPFPVIALGGIDETNIVQTFKAGAKGIAAIRLFRDIKKFSEILKQIPKFKSEN